VAYPLLSKAMSSSVTVSAERLLRKRRPEFVDVTPSSVALFRLGEQCNNGCPMCSNTGRSEAFFIETLELVRRVESLAYKGFRRLVLTGGEPTIHPGFWDVVQSLGKHGVIWDINSHGRTFADASFADRARDEGLEKAIISLHSQDLKTSCLISGVKAKAHHETVQGIKNLCHVGVQVMVNFVITRQNHHELSSFVDYCEQSFGASVEIKYAFPSTSGKGGQWDGIQVRYHEVEDELRRARERGREVGVKIHVESVPPCILRDANAKNLGRSGFGETHYVEDVHGEAVFSIEHIEASFTGYPSSCRECGVLRTCPGVSLSYLETYGEDEFSPFSST
jgi:MoaA/NifB/PqqE/SkfB family radical SAM enzyme